MRLGLYHRVAESQPPALVDVGDRDAREGVAEPVDDPGGFVPDDHDQLVDARFDGRVERVREQRFAGDIDEPLRSIVRQRSEPRSASGGRDDRVHTGDTAPSHLKPVVPRQAADVIAGSPRVDDASTEYSECFRRQRLHTRSSR